VFFFFLNHVGFILNNKVTEVTEKLQKGKTEENC